MFNIAKWGTKKKRLIKPQRNLIGQTISVGELVKVARSKEDSQLIDIMSISKPKRIIRNVPTSCVESFQKKGESMENNDHEDGRESSFSSIPDSIKKLLRR